MALVLALASLGFASVVLSQDQKPAAAPAEIVVYAVDLPKSALFEFEVWSDSTSPGGKMVGTPNTGDMLHPPPEEDPHVRFKVSVQTGVPYRCWVHMKVGAPKGFSKANRLYVQFSDAIDTTNKEVLKPGTASYLTAQGLQDQSRGGWPWSSLHVSSSRSSADPFARECPHTCKRGDTIMTNSVITRSLVAASMFWVLAGSSAEAQPVPSSAELEALR